MGWWNNDKNRDDRGGDGYGMEPHAVPPSYPIQFSQQPNFRPDYITWHYPPAQAEHGRWYNNVYFGNAIPNSMLGVSRVIPGVHQLPWAIQYNREITPYQLPNTSYPYGGGNNSTTQIGGLLATLSQAYAGLVGGNKNG